MNWAIVFMRPSKEIEHNTCFAITDRLDGCRLISLFILKFGSVSFSSSATTSSHIDTLRLTGCFVVDLFIDLNQNIVVVSIFARVVVMPSKIFNIFAITVTYLEAMDFAFVCVIATAAISVFPLPTLFNIVSFRFSIFLTSSSIWGDSTLLLYMIFTKMTAPNRNLYLMINHLLLFEM